MGSMALDFSTYVVSFAIAMGMFGIFRKTVDWPQTARVLILVATVFTAAVSNTHLDIVYTDWGAANVDRKSFVEGKRVSVRDDIVVRGIIQNKYNNDHKHL